MSIGPIASFPPAESAQAVEPVVGSSRAEAGLGSDTAEEPVQSVSGTLPKQEASSAQNVSSTYELPEDVVEVHQDPEIKSQVIVQYLDQAKNLILQVPSTQELGVERGIAQDLQQAAKLRTSADTAAAGSEGEKTHGD